MYPTNGIIVLLALIPAVFSTPILENGMSLVPKQYIPAYAPQEQCCKVNCKVKPADNPNVHFPWHFTQVTDYTECDDTPGCSAAYTTSFTEGYSVSGGFSIGWITAGVDVSESWSKADGHTCIGKADTKVCVWMRVAYATYDVTADGTPICKLDGTETMSSPLARNPGGFYCVEGDACKAKGDGYWCTPGTDC